MTCALISGGSAAEISLSRCFTAHPHPHAGGAPTHNGRRAPELTAGIGRVNSAKSIGVCTGNWPTLRQAQAPLNAPDITTAQEARDSAIVAVLLGCALRRSEVAALADGRCSGDRRRLPAQLSASGPAGSPSGRRSRSRTRRTSRTPRACAPAPSSRRAARLRPAPFRGGGASRWALFGRIHAGGDGCRTFLRVRRLELYSPCFQRPDRKSTR